MATTSITDYLKSQGKDSSYAARIALANSLGIPGYTGTAAENTALLSKLQGTPTSGGLSMLTGSGANALVQPSTSTPSLTSFQAPQIAQASLQQTPAQLAQPTLLGKVVQAVKSQAGNLTANISKAVGPQPGSGTPTPGPSVYDYGTPGTSTYIPAQIVPQQQTVQPVQQSVAPTTGLSLLSGTGDTALIPEGTVAPQQIFSPAILDSSAHQSAADLSSSVQRSSGSGSGASAGVSSGVSSGISAGSGVVPQAVLPSGVNGAPIDTTGLNVPINQTYGSIDQSGSVGVPQVQDATIGQNGQAPMQVGGRFGTQQFGKVGNDVVEIMSDGSQRKVTEEEFNQKLKSQGLNLDVLPQVEQTSGFQDGASTGLAGSGPDGIMGTADDVPEKGPSDFVSDYTAIIKELGLTDIKGQFQDIQKQYTDLQDKKLEEQAAVNDNPWLSEGLRQRKIASIGSKYESKEASLTNQMNLYQSLYEEGVAQAKFLTSGLQEDRNKLLDLAMKREEAQSALAQQEFENALDLQNLSMKEKEFALEQYKASKTSSGNSDLTTAQMNATINSIAGSFDNEAIVKNYNVIAEGYQFAKSLSDSTKNPADDQALIYSLAKALDPGSVVREGEYATAQKYAQSWINAYGSGVQQAIAGTGFLSQTARTNIKKTIEQRYLTSKTNYDNVYNQYQQRINNVKQGGFNTLTDYGAAFPESDTGGGQTYTPGTTLKQDHVVYLVGSDGVTMTPIASY
jgi:hypothetical protein